MFKNKLKIVMATSLFMFCNILGLQNVNAGTIKFCACSGITLTSSFFTAAGNAGMVTYDIDKTDAIWDGDKVLYCLEKGKPLTTSSGSPSGSYVKVTNPTATDKMIARVIAYGYPSSSTSGCECPAVRAATQMLVQIVAHQGANGEWKNYTEAKFRSFMTSGSSRGASVASNMYSIKNKVLSVDTKPSFANQTVTLKYNPTNYNWEGSTTDTNGVLSNWTKKDNGGLKSVSISGNKVTLVSGGSPTTGKVEFSKEVPGGTLYRSDYSSSYQKTAHFVTGTAEKITIPLNYTLEEIGKGIVKIHKTDKFTGGNMQGATFGIFSDDNCSKKAKDYLGNELPEKTTNKNGIISWDNLYYPLKVGSSTTYYVKETKPVKGYTFDNEELDKLGAKNACVPVKLVADYKEGSSSEIEKKEEFEQGIYNIPYGNITILKQDEETGKVVEGVEFELRRNNSKKEPAIDIYGNPVKNVITDERGIAEFENIPYGDYILTEVKTNGWYKVLEKPLEFTLNKENDALKYVSQGTEAIPGEDEPMIPFETYKLGDPTDDGVINNDDILIIDQIIKKEIEETPLQFYASDVNKDNVVDEKDKELMQKYIDGDKEAIPNALTEEDIPGQVQKRVTLSITNVPIDMKVSKLAVGGTKELKGAKIVIKNAKGEVFIKYVSDGKPKEFYIPMGDYTLIETVAPKGYQTLKTEVKFRVLSDGNIKLLSAKSNMYKLDKSKEDNDTDLDHLKIFNELKEIPAPKTGSVIAISTIVVGILLIGGGSYVIYQRYKQN